MKIEKGIPIPPKGNRTRGEMHRILINMAVNDSVLVETRNQQVDAYKVAKRINIKVTTRKQNGNGFRIWRTS